MIGLKRGTVAICAHDPEWEKIANDAIVGLGEIFGERAVDVQHIGSTAIPHIKAKPIIDIAVGVQSFDGLEAVKARLIEAGYSEANNRFSSDLLYIINDGENRRTHQVHVLIYGCEQWRNYVDFRDYMNLFPEKAKEYEALKEQLVEECENIQTRYTDGKREYMKKMLDEAKTYMAGKRE